MKSLALLGIGAIGIGAIGIGAIGIGAAIAAWTHNPEPITSEATLRPTMSMSCCSPASSSHMKVMAATEMASCPMGSNPETPPAIPAESDSTTAASGGEPSACH